MSEAKAITASTVVSGLKKRYCAPEWATFFNVANGTGARGCRYADAISMCLYPSRGLEIHGFEIKVSKTDYRREAADPDKAETIAAYCDRWWVVTPPHLLDSELLPPKWGWLAYDGRAFYTRQKAEKTVAKTLDRDFLAALLRRAQESNEKLLELQLKEKAESMEAEIQRRVANEVQNRTREHERLKTSVSEFEKSSGLKLNTWSGSSDLGRAVAIVEACGVTALYSNTFELADRLKRIGESVEKALADAGMARPKAEAA